MKHALTVAAFAALMASPAVAQDAQIIRLGDEAMNCEAIVAQANEATTVMGAAPVGGVFGSSAAVNAATSVAVQSAIVSGAGRAIPGLGFAGNMLGAAARRREEEQAAARATAERRWYYLNGLYQGRNCASQPAAQSESAPTAAAGE